MSDKKEDNILAKAFRASMHASQAMQQTAFDIPLNILKELGVAEDKMVELRNKSHELIGGMYAAIDQAAVKTGFVQPTESAAPSKKKAKG